MRPMAGLISVNLLPETSKCSSFSSPKTRSGSTAIKFLATFNVSSTLCSFSSSGASVVRRLPSKMMCRIDAMPHKIFGISFIWLLPTSSCVSEPCHLLQLRQYLYFCTRKASTFVPVKQMSTILPISVANLLSLFERSDSCFTKPIVPNHAGTLLSATFSIISVVIVSAC